MKILAAAAVAALALPTAAAAKELTSVAVCGPSGCASAALSGFGHDEPLYGSIGERPAAPARFYRLDLGIDVGATWSMYYVPSSRLVAFGPAGTVGIGSGFTNWSRIDPTFARIVDGLARRVDPFPAPKLSQVHVGEQAVTGDPSSFLRVFTLAGAPALYAGVGTVTIRMRAAVPNPWSDSLVLYDPNSDVLQISASRIIRVPRDVAADIEAARPLGAGDADGAPRIVPWVAIAIVATFALALLVRRFLRPAPQAAPTG
jgi:hypothetical protein